MKRKPVGARPPNRDDQWLAETNVKCAKAMAQWLKTTLNIRRPIQSLNVEEMKALAGVAWSTYIVEISKRKAEAPESAELLRDLYFI